MSDYLIGGGYTTGKDSPCKRDCRFLLMLLFVGKVVTELSGFE